MRYLAAIFILIGLACVSFSALSISRYNYSKLLDKIELAEVQLRDNTDGRVFDMTDEEVLSGEFDYRIVRLKNSGQTVLVRDVGFLAWNPVFTRSYLYGSLGQFYYAEKIAGSEQGVYIETVVTKSPLDVYPVIVDIAPVERRPTFSAETRRYGLLAFGVVLLVLGGLLVSRRKLRTSTR